MFILRVADALDREGVAYALIGGYAVSLHGAVRGTLDIDIVLQHEERSFVGAEKALNSLGLVCRVPVTAHDVFAHREDYMRDKHMAAWSFSHPDNPFELVDIVVMFDLRQLQTTAFTVEGRLLRVVTLEELIRIKKRSPREQDRLDVEALEKLG